MTPPPALVLTAGLGTRLRPLTLLRAKAAVPVNGEPLAVRVARWLAALGIRDQVFNLHHHPESIAAALGDGSGLDIRVRYSWEARVLGSAGGPRRALPLLLDGGAPHFLIVNGDTLTDVNLTAMLDAHQASGARVTMALIPNPAPEKYGGVSVSVDGFVNRFTRRGEVRESYHFIGVQVAAAEVFAGLPDNVPAESVGALYPQLMRTDPRAIGAFVSTAGFRDIGTPSDCLRTSLELAREEGERLISPAARIATGAVLERTIVWDDVSIGRGARLVDCIVGDGVNIPAGAVHKRCAIVPARDHAAAPHERIIDGLLVHPLPGFPNDDD
jgi:NDP-sugar pyrophosphorylase family protein